ncbi:MAG: hypothetical protein HDS41_05775 [Bacteroides sp.]|nr:hypothetical protein [Bacteroides sp.]
MLGIGVGCFLPHADKSAWGFAYLDISDVGGGVLGQNGIGSSVDWGFGIVRCQSFLITLMLVEWFCQDGVSWGM